MPCGVLWLGNPQAVVAVSHLYNPRAQHCARHRAALGGVRLPAVTARRLAVLFVQRVDELVEAQQAVVDDLHDRRQRHAHVHGHVGTQVGARVWRGGSTGQERIMWVRYSQSITDGQRRRQQLLPAYRYGWHYTHMSQMYARMYVRIRTGTVAAAIHARNL
eukprot:43895-Chlamydomonas_euryale.AAC.8